MALKFWISSVNDQLMVWFCFFTSDYFISTFDIEVPAVTSYCDFYSDKL